MWKMLTISAALLMSAAPALAGNTAQEEANKKVVLDLYEKGINQKDFEAAAKNFGPRYVQHNPRAADGPEGFKAFIGFLKAKFPNYHSEIKRCSPTATTSSCTSTTWRNRASAALRSWISSGLKAAKWSSTGTCARISPRNRLIVTPCSDSRSALPGFVRAMI